jgi:hypothetical protein
VWPAIAAHAANNGLAAGLLLALGATEAPAEAAAGQIGATLAVGACGLGLLLAAYRAAAPAPPPDLALVRVDPASPDLRWRPERVPRGLALLAVAGAVTLFALALAGLVRGAAHGP